MHSQTFSSVNVCNDFLQCIYFSTRTYLKTSLTGCRLWIFSSIFGKRIQRTEIRSWHLCIDGRGAVQCGGRYGWAQCGLLLQWQRQQKQQQQWQRQLHHHHHDRKKRLRNVCCLLLIMKRKQKRNRVYGNWKSYSVFGIQYWELEEGSSDCRMNGLCAARSESELSLRRLRNDFQCIYFLFRSFHELPIYLTLLYFSLLL